MEKKRNVKERSSTIYCISPRNFPGGVACCPTKYPNYDYLQILMSSSLMILMVSALPQLPSPAFPNAAHTSLLDPSLSAHPNAAHTSPLNPSLSAHPNAAHTAISADCARFSGAFPCAPGDSACQADYRSSGCGK